MTAAERTDVSARKRSLDVTAALQKALDTVSGTILFPPGDYLVGPGPHGYAMFVRDRSISLVGDDAQIYSPSRGNHQALRMERCTNSSLRGIRFRGAGVDGADGDRGMVQIFLGSNFTAENCAFDDAVCDGLRLGDKRVMLFNSVRWPRNPSAPDWLQLGRYQPFPFPAERSFSYTPPGA
jgi:hypothetical protein